jgi:hypothetical protein
VPTTVPEYFARNNLRIEVRPDRDPWGAIDGREPIVWSGASFSFLQNLRILSNGEAVIREGNCEYLYNPRTGRPFVSEYEALCVTDITPMKNGYIGKIGERTVELDLEGKMRSAGGK